MAAFLLGNVALAQVTTEPSSDIDPEEELKIIVDISKLSSDDFAENLKDSVANGADVYIWTWSPAEHPEGHPLANGVGAQAWKNSNDSLRMTKEGGTIFSYTMVPTEFYEVDAQTVYDNDIEFLVKTKDGGGFGDPDVKSNDLSIPIDPPDLEREPAFMFPSKFGKDDVVAFTYDNNEEEKPTMQNLHPDSAYFFAQATLSDSTVVKIAQNNFTVGNFPKLKMEETEDGIFKKYFVPSQFFSIPEDKELMSITLFVQKPFFQSGDDRIGYDVKANMSCE